MNASFKEHRTGWEFSLDARDTYQGVAFNARPGDAEPTFGVTDPSVPGVGQVVSGIHLHPIGALQQIVLCAFKDRYWLLFGLFLHDLRFGRSRFLFLSCTDVIVLVPVHGRLCLAGEQIAFEFR